MSIFIEYMKSRIVGNEWKRIQKNNEIGKREKVFLFPETDAEFNRKALSVLPRVLDEKYYKSACVICMDCGIEKIAKKMDIVDRIRIITVSPVFIERFIRYLMLYSISMTIVSLKMPESRKDCNLCGFGDITEEKLIERCIFNLK